MRPVYNSYNKNKKNYKNYKPAKRPDKKCLRLIFRVGVYSSSVLLALPKEVNNLKIFEVSKILTLQLLGLEPLLERALLCKNL
jgi:hypothetical protein